LSGEPRIVLATLNARYAHASMGLRCLAANLGELRTRTRILELEITTPRGEIVEHLVHLAPTILGLGVYVWNVAETTAVVRDLRALSPNLLIVLGGPEVSYEPDDQPIVALANYVIAGEGEVAFAALARALVAGERPVGKLIAARTPDLAALALPYAEYTDDDVAHRVIYVEASRGCPYACEFCLSALDVAVRSFPLDALLEALDGLIARGARNFKFVDRTFNLSMPVATRILEFFLDRHCPGLHVHFELIPDRLPPAILELAARFPPDALQFEIGIQTFTPNVNRGVSRRQNDDVAVRNLIALRDTTRVHVHADLLFGLPGETIDTFGASFDRLLPLVPTAIQIGILKRLRGTPIVRHESASGLVFSPSPPYEVLRTDAASFDHVLAVKRLARAFEAFRNSGEHASAMALLFAQGGSPWAQMRAFTEWLFVRIGRAWGLALPRRCELLWDWLVAVRGVPPADAARATIEDFYLRAPRSERLVFLEPHVDTVELTALQRRNRSAAQATTNRRESASCSR